MKQINIKRTRQIKKGKIIKGPVAYFMSRDQRISDNWALIFAQEKAIENNQPLVVCFCLNNKFPNANLRNFHFMLGGLKDLEYKFSEKNIPFFLLKGDPADEIPKFISENNVSTLIGDFSPLKIKQVWNRKIIQEIKIPYFEVDAHNIVPVWETSNKQEFAARTIRPKIHVKIAEFLEEFPKIQKQKITYNKIQKVDWKEILNTLKIDRNIKPVDWIFPGENQAFKILKYFINYKLKNYDKDRNNPNIDGLSNLSPYLHFGQISAQRVALEVNKSFKESLNNEKFLEELIIRRELSDNFCYNSRNYDNFFGLPDWSQKTLNKHRDDKRDYIYSLEELENAKTHDGLWNAAQKEMSLKGKMHGFMRMYWAKKILEWSKDAAEAVESAIYLNDKYSLDGRDPNGYVGILWSIGGLHDRPWFERPVFGNVRYMSYQGCKNKFDVEKYISTFY